MGYSYDLSGRLCCDACPVSNGVRKVHCPFGYCPATALCKECRKTHKDKLSKAHHRERGCEKSHLAFQAEQDAEKAHHAAGTYTLKAAVGLFDGTGRVCVTFWLGTGETFRDYIMHEDVYDKRDTFQGTPTLSFFQAIGEVKPINDGAILGTKQV